MSFLFNKRSKNLSFSLNNIEYGIFVNEWTQGRCVKSNYPKPKIAWTGDGLLNETQNPD